MLTGTAELAGEKSSPNVESQHLCYPASRCPALKLPGIETWFEGNCNFKRLNKKIDTHHCSYPALTLPGNIATRQTATRDSSYWLEHGKNFQVQATRHRGGGRKTPQMSSSRIVATRHSSYPAQRGWGKKPLKFQVSAPLLPGKLLPGTRATRH